MNENQITVCHLDEINDSCLPLPTSLDINLKQASAQTFLTGYFDLQSPLFCPSDIYEPNDDLDHASSITPNEAQVTTLFDISQDEDWFKFYSLAGSKNVIETVNLAAGVDTVLDLYDIDGTTLLSSNDNYGAGLGSYIEWRAPIEGTYFIRISQAPGSSFGCSSSYEIKVTQTNYLYLPLILRVF